jgi:hypothetical protein
MGLPTLPEPNPQIRGWTVDKSGDVGGAGRSADIPRENVTCLLALPCKHWIKGDLIPEAAAEEIIGELQSLFARHNAGAALSAKAVFKPTKEFHTARHTLYSAEENMEIDKVVPVRRA